MIDFKRKEPVSNFRLNTFLYRGPNCQNLARQVLWFLIVIVTGSRTNVYYKGEIYTIVHCTFVNYIVSNLANNIN